MVAEILIVPEQGGLDAAKAGAQYVARSLASVGIKVRDQISLCTDRRKLQQAVAVALGRSNVLIAIGGMGRETGFLTKTVIGQGLNLAMERSPECLEAVKDYCRRAGEPFLAGDEQLADLPQTGRVYLPSYGKIPGCGISSSSQHIIMLPEGSQELAAMMGRYVLPLLSGSAASATVTHAIRTYGVGENYVRERLGEITASANPAVTVQRDGATEVLVRVSARAADNAGAAAICTPVLGEIASRLGDAAYGLDVDSLQTAVVSKMRKKNLGLAIAEAGSGGMLTRVLGETPGGQEILRYSVNADNDEFKIKKLDVVPKLLKKRGRISEYVAVAVANGARVNAQTDLGVAIVANTQDTRDKDSTPGTVYIAVCDEGNVYVKKLLVGEGTAHPDVVVDAALSRALNMVRLFVDYYPENYPGCVSLEEALRGRRNVTDSDSYDTYPDETGMVAGSAGGFRDNFTIRKADEPKEKVRKFVFILAVLIFLGSGGYLGYYYYESYSAAKQQALLENMFRYGLDLDDVEVSEDFPSDYLDVFGPLWTYNNDIVGFISIDDTLVAYPIVQSDLDDGENYYYLRRDFFGSSSNHGIPFLDFRGDIQKPSDNLIIYGHNMKDGQIFGELLNYQHNLEYYREHPTVNFSTLYEVGEYKIFATFLTNSTTLAGQEPFAYHDFIDASSVEDFEEYVYQLQVRSIINTTVDVQPGDKLLTLSTCAYDFDDARFVIVARKTRFGESSSVNVEDAYINPNPLYPDIWYQLKGGTRPIGVESADVVTSVSLDLRASEDAPMAGGIPAADGGPSLVRLSASSPADFLGLTGGMPEVQTLAATPDTASLYREIRGYYARDQIDTDTPRTPSSPMRPGTATPPEDSGSSGSSGASRPAGNGNTLTVRYRGEVIEADALEIVARVVQNEVGSSFHEEAIKAQAVAAYTYILHQNQTTVPTVYLASSVSDKVYGAVEEVLGEAVYYNGKLAFTPYFATSAGATNGSEEVWNGSYPYLVSVDSAVDKQVGTYRQRATMSSDKVADLLEAKLGIPVTGDPDSWFEVLSLTSGGYNDRMAVCGETKTASGSAITGRLLRENVLGLRSAAFDVEYDAGGDRFVFTTYGFGHGVGMSQNGANQYAQRGWSYIDILEHYYTGAYVQ